MTQEGRAIERPTAASFCRCCRGPVLRRRDHRVRRTVARKKERARARR